MNIEQLGLQGSYNTAGPLLSSQNTSVCGSSFANQGQFEEGRSVSGQEEQEPEPEEEGPHHAHEELAFFIFLSFSSGGVLLSAVEWSGVERERKAGREGTKDRWGITVQSGFGRWARREDGGGVSCRLWSRLRCSRVSWSFRRTARVLYQRSYLGHTGGASVHDVVAPPSSLFCSAGNPWLARGGTQTRCARCYLPPTVSFSVLVDVSKARNWQFGADLNASRPRHQELSSSIKLVSISRVVLAYYGVLTFKPAGRLRVPSNSNRIKAPKSSLLPVDNNMTARTRNVALLKLPKAASKPLFLHFSCSVDSDHEETLEKASSHHSPRPSRSGSEATNSVLSRDAGGQPHSDSSPGPSVAGDLPAVQNKAMDNTAQLPPSEHICPSGESQSSHDGMPSSPSAEHDQTAPNAGGDAIGNGPGPRGAGIRDPFPRARFGLKHGEQKVHRSPTDYRAKYAEDLPYKELDDEARVWHVYNDESEIFDNDMVIESSDSLDILLVFAGLFSSVLTTFVAQTSQALSPDNTAVSNSILLELVSLQRAQANGTSFESIPHADVSFTVALSDVWVNGLWFTSLMLSLTTALLAVLAKQWLRQYTSFIAGSARERATIRQFRYASFDKWGVQSIIGLLPAILHLSLFLFMAGLVVFLYALNHVMATIMACIAGCLLGIYIVTNVLPILVIGCPFRTPLTPLLYSFIYGLGRDFVRFLRITRKFGRCKDKFLRQAERTYVRRHETLCINSALSWLASTTSDPSAKLILVEALGLVHPPLNFESLRFDFRQQWRNIALPPNTPCNEMQLGRLIRSTVSQSDDSLILTMWDYLQWMPLCVRDPAMVLTTAACGHTSTFDWDNNRLVLPPQDTFGFVIEHYTEFDQLTVPMWMWLSICIQAVMEEEIPPPGSMPGNFENVFLDVSKSNTYNTVPERNKLLAWFQQHLIPDGLWHSVDHGPFTYHNRYIPVSLATFLAVIKQGRSFDNSSHWIKNTPRSFLDNVLLNLEHHSAPPQSLQSLVDNIP
ncbi:hypothetical protein B0H14DRAFT_3150565 [Mycena olivaceomarginata]|nr:hypothetical protein B0H14DRAFT_3150565 [Mycena olivaceomarginata]